MDHIDSKFIGLLSPRLGKFKRVKANLYNFRCPICGDSQKNKSKARGYLYAIKTSINYKCHNCGASMTFNNFLKKVDANLYSQYALEKFKDGKQEKDLTGKIRKNSYSMQNHQNQNLREKSGLDYQTHMKRREEATISVEEKYRDLFSTQKDSKSS